VDVLARVEMKDVLGELSQGVSYLRAQQDREEIACVRATVSSAFVFSAGCQPYLVR
jgi:hypothetical protein